MTGDVPVGDATVLVYGGDRMVRLEVARVLRGNRCRVLLASSAAEAAKALSAGDVRVIAAMSPVEELSGSLRGGAVVLTSDALRSAANPNADALAWAERIRAALNQATDQPTSSA